MGVSWLLGRDLGLSMAVSMDVVSPRVLHHSPQSPRKSPDRDRTTLNSSCNGSIHCSDLNAQTSSTAYSSRCFQVLAIARQSIIP